MKSLHHKIETIGNIAVDAFHLLGLFAIGATIVWTAVHEYLIIMEQPYAKLGDILLLFIYLELGAMVGIYFKTKRLPVIFLLFISLTAFTRYLAVDLKYMEESKIIILVGSIFILSAAAFVLRYSEDRYGQNKEEMDPPSK
jgi:phosphate starvation-inducible membrane PsiE